MRLCSPHLASGLILTLALAGCELPSLPASTGSGLGDTRVIDLDIIAQALGRDAALRDQLTSANETLTGKINELASGLKSRLEEEKSKLGEDPSGEQRAAYRDLATQAQQELRRGQALARQRSQEFQVKLVNQFRSEVLPFAQRVAAAQGGTIVLVKPNVLWFDPRADITQSVVEAMRAASTGAGKAADTGTPTAAPAKPQG